MFLRKDRRGRQVIKSIQIDPIEFDVFRVNNVDEYSRLQVPMFIPKTIQPIIIVGGTTISVSDLVSGSNEGEEDGCDNLKDYASNSFNE